MEGDTSFTDADHDEAYYNQGGSGAVPAIASLNEASLRSGMIRTVSGAQLAGGGGVARTAPPPELDNPTPQLVPPPTHAVTGTIGEKHVLVMARARGGLARGAARRGARTHMRRAR
jgi:hypothetical protein